MTDIAERTRLLAHTKQAKKVAGQALSALANAGLLSEALTDLPTLRSVVEQAVLAQSADVLLTSRVLSHVNGVLHGNDLDSLAVAGQVVEQLEHVRSFAVSDGGAWDKNIVAVEGLIRSGRVDLFSR